MLHDAAKLFRYSVLLGLLATSLAACGPSAADPLPSEDDLYKYSLAVAEKVRLKVPPGRYAPVYLVGKVHQRFGLEEKALEVFREAARLEPNAPEPHRDIGYILSQRKGRMVEAVEAYQRSLLADPSQTGIYTRIGMVLIHQSKLEEAIDALEREVRRGGADEFTYYQLGQAHQLQHQYEKAVEYYDKAPGMREAIYAKYKSLQLLGRKEEAAEALEKFRKIKDEATAAEFEADQKSPKSNREEQLVHTAATWEDAGGIFLQEHRREEDKVRRRKYMDEALHAMNEALRFDKYSVSVYRFLVDHYREHQMLDESLDILTRAVDALPEDPTFRYDLGLLRLHLAPQSQSPSRPTPEAEQAIRELEKAVELAPDFGAAHLLLAKAILFRKRQAPLLAKALGHARKALALSKQPIAENYDILAMAQHFAGDLNGARDTLRKGVDRFPNDAALRQRLSKYQQILQ